jgi:hypothetical protein
VRTVRHDFGVFVHAGIEGDHRSPPTLETIGFRAALSTTQQHGGQANP